MWNKALVPSTPRGRLFIVSAPAGAGKTTLVRRLVQTFPAIVQVPSVTTRPMRTGEADGIDYLFVSKEEFERRGAAGEFLEQIELHGHQYATSKQEIEKKRSSGCHVVLVIDTRGALSLKKEPDAVLIFVKAPIEVLKRRLIERGTEDEPTIQRRIQWAERELADESQFQYSIINDRLDDAFDILASIVVAECHKV